MCLYNVIVYSQNGSMAHWLERQSSKREIVGSSPAANKNFSFCNSRFLRVPRSLTKPLRMESTYTPSEYPV